MILNFKTHTMTLVTVTQCWNFKYVPILLTTIPSIYTLNLSKQVTDGSIYSRDNIRVTLTAPQLILKSKSFTTLTHYYDRKIFSVHFRVDLNSLMWQTVDFKPTLTFTCLELVLCSVVFRVLQDQTSCYFSYCYVSILASTSS